MKFSEILGIVGAASASNSNSPLVPGITHPRKVTSSSSVSVSGASSSRMVNNFGQSGRNRKHSGGNMTDMELVRLGMGYVSDSNVINNPAVNFRKIRKRSQNHIEDSNSNLTPEENLYYQVG